MDGIDVIRFVLFPHVVKFECYLDGIDVIRFVLFPHVVKFECYLDGIDVIRFVLFPNVVTKPLTMNLKLKSKQATICIRYYAEIHNFLNNICAQCLLHIYLKG